MAMCALTYLHVMVTSYFVWVAHSRNSLLDERKWIIVGDHSVRAIVVAPRMSSVYLVCVQV